MVKNYCFHKKTISSSPVPLMVSYSSKLQGHQIKLEIEMTFRRIVDGGIKKPVALASNHAQREIFVFDQVSAKVTFLSDSGRFITQISTKLKTDLTGMVHFDSKYLK